MHELYELKEMLTDELKKYGGKKDLSAGSLEVVDKLTHTIKNLCKIIEDSEGEYSGYYPMSYDDSAYARGGNGRSYARGRTGNVRRDSMGRYSRANEDVKERLMEIMEEVPEHMKSDIQRVINKM